MMWNDVTDPIRAEQLNYHGADHSPNLIIVLTLFFVTHHLCFRQKVEGRDNDIDQGEQLRSGAGQTVHIARYLVYRN